MSKHKWSHLLFIFSCLDLVKRYLSFLHTESIQQLLFYVRVAQTGLRLLSRACLFERSLMELDPYTLTHTLHIFTYFSLLEKHVEWVFTMYISGLLP